MESCLAVVSSGLTKMGVNISNVQTSPTETPEDTGEFDPHVKATQTASLAKTP